MNIELKTIPLRDRPEGVAGLARHIVATFCQEHGLPVPILGEATEIQLRDYDWPGNVRELRNVLERVLLVNEGHELSPRCLSMLLSLATNCGETPCAAGPRCLAAAPAGKGDPEPSEPWLRLDDLERAHLQKTLERTLYNQTAAADLLGITRRVLARLMKKHGLGDARSPRTRRWSADLAEAGETASHGCQGF